MALKGQLQDRKDSAKELELSDRWRRLTATVGGRGTLGRGTRGPGV